MRKWTLSLRQTNANNGCLSFRFDSLFVGTNHDGMANWHCGKQQQHVDVATNNGCLPFRHDSFCQPASRNRMTNNRCLRLLRPSTAVFIDDDNYSVSGNLSESLIDSEFPASSALVYWRFFGDSAFHKKLSPWQIPMSIDLEDSIIVLLSATCRK